MATESDRDIVRAKEPTTELEKLIINDPYRSWLASEGVQIIDEFAFEDLHAVELGPWERKGGKGSVINIPYPMLINDSQLIEIKPGGKSEPEHHLYEEIVYVLSGRGATSVWVDDGPKQTFECTYNDPDFIFNNNYVFKGRYGEEETFFSGSGKLYSGRVWQASFLPNVPDMPLYSWEGRGAGGINVMFDMAGNQMKGHVSEFPVGTYKKGHQHGPGAHLLILSGDAGYSLTWTKEDMSDVVKSDWKVGSMVIVPSAGCYHQHFNSGSRRARYLAIGYGSGGEAPGLYAPFAGSGGADVSQKEGGMQVEYEDENPMVLDMFEEDCIKHGAMPDMRRYFPDRNQYKVTLPA
jgi:mannose-6-phosphate isomerase-like protein (cupin superfamily)